MSRPLDLTGHQYGRLTVVGAAPRNIHGHFMWECVCECGGRTTTSTCNLRTGHSKSCGCLFAETLTKHGHSSAEQRSPAYSSWGSMIQRCTNPNVPEYAKYGGVGITVCTDWRGPGGFNRFLEHIGPRPEGRYSIDRINGTKGYEPGNVRWATTYEQSRNQKSNVWIEVDGERMIVRDAAKKYGINDKTLRYRLRKMPVMDALTKPVADKFGRARREVS